MNKEQPVLTPAVSQMSMLPTIDREGITKFINEQGYLTYIVRAVKINSYLKSLMSLAGLLSQFNICITAAEDVKNDVAELIRNYVNGLHDAGKYDELTKQVMEMKLSVQIFDVFGEKIQSDNHIDMFTASESDLDRQLRVADAKWVDAVSTWHMGVNISTSTIRTPLRWIVFCSHSTASVLRN